MLYKGKPIYKAALTENPEETGMYLISLVDDPAVEANFMSFSKEKYLSFKVENEEKRIVTGLVMAADRPILRQDLDGLYYIMYDKDTINAMAERFLAMGLANNVDTQHNFEVEKDVFLREMYIKDTERGISPAGFEDVEDGSLFATYHILNDEVWEKVKSGEFKGFSLAGIFQEVEMSKVEDDITDEEYEEAMGYIDQLNRMLK
ncbi:MAG: hypothetical protein J6U51_09215 [Bacteroidales bacterium]|nr:hypothetical protein [Bacteroidales bacterium]